MIQVRRITNFYCLILYNFLHKTWTQPTLVSKYWLFFKSAYNFIKKIIENINELLMSSRA